MAVFLFFVLFVIVAGIWWFVHLYRSVSREARVQARREADQRARDAERRRLDDERINAEFTRIARDRASREPELLSVGRDLASDRPQEWSERAALCMCGRLEDDKACHARWCPYRTG